MQVKNDIAVQSTSAQNASQADSKRAAPNAGDVENFSRAMKQEVAEKRNADAGREKPQDLFSREESSAKTDSKSEAKSDSVLFLEQMFQGKGAETAAMRAGGAAAAEGAMLSDERLDVLVSRILVSSPENGSSQVRLTINDAHLAATEILITRDVTGMLRVSIVTQNAQSFQTLVASRQTLVDMLQNKESQPVTVNVQNSSDESEGDMNRRSRGLDQQTADSE